MGQRTRDLITKHILTDNTLLHAGGLLRTKQLIEEEVGHKINYFSFPQDYKEVKEEIEK